MATNLFTEYEACVTRAIATGLSKTDAQRIVAKHFARLMSRKGNN